MENKNYKKFLQIKEEKKFDTLREISAYLTKGMGISDEDIGIVSVCSRPALMVERSKYGEVLKGVRQYVANNHLEDKALWIDYYGIEHSFEEVPLIYMQVNSANSNYSWQYRIDLPEKVRNYYLALEDFMGCNLGYVFMEQGNEFLVTAKSRDYDLMQIRKDEFIGLFGNGPFNNILPLDKDGKVIEKKLPNKVRILK